MPPYVRRWISSPLIRRVAAAIFITLIAMLLIIQAKKFDWHAVVQSVRTYDAQTVLIAALFAILAYTIYSCFDVLGKNHVGANVRAKNAMSIAFVSYAFNQNFGALIGAVGLRMRLYVSLGLDVSTISRIIVLSVATNWLGHLTLMGILCSLSLIHLPATWGISTLIVRTIGVSLLAAALLYLWLCGQGARRLTLLHRVQVELPSLPVAFAQLFLSMAHWLAIAASIYVLLHHKIAFITVFATFMLASIAVLIAHLPAGIGVLESMFIVLLGNQIPPTELLAGILVFRAIFQLGALAVAALVYLLLEASFTPSKLQTASRRLP